MQPPSFSGFFRTDFAARAAYSEGAGIFRIIPDAVAVPSTTRALVKLVRWAAKQRTPLVPRGAGSGMGGGNVGSGLMLDLTVLDGRPLDIDRTGIAVTGTAVTLGALQTQAARLGLRLPPDPSSARFATLGGMVSTNAAGPASVRSGSVRRWVRALEFVTADGEVCTLRRGEPASAGVAAIDRFRRGPEPGLRRAADTIRAKYPRTRKNASGYALDAWVDSNDLLDLVIGSEGTLGIITRIEWALEPILAHRGGLRAGIRSLPDLAVLIPDLRELQPSALEFLDATLLRFIGTGSEGIRATWEGVVMVEFESEDQGEIEQRVARAGAILGPISEDLRQTVDPRAMEQLWEIRHAASPRLASLGEERRSMQVIEDACVPPERVPEYVAAVRAAGVRHGIALVIFGHLGDGNVHVNLLPDITRRDWESSLRAIFEEVSDCVVALGGTPSGEHGDGRLRVPLLEKVYGTEIVELFRQVKRAFDPNGILNPGVKVPGLTERVLEPLKVGAQATPIPEAIEQGLRTIERTAGYAMSRLELATGFGTRDSGIVS